MSKWDEELKGKIEEVLIAISYTKSEQLRNWKVKEKIVDQIFGFCQSDRKYQRELLMERLPVVSDFNKIMFDKGFISEKEILIRDVWKVSSEIVGLIREKLEGKK